MDSRGMNEKTELHGWLAAKNFNIECLGAVQNLGECAQYNHLLDRFPEDCVFLSEESRVCFMDGYIYNKSEMIASAAGPDWQHAFASSLFGDGKAHLQKLRGAFCGYAYDIGRGSVLIYTDQVSNKALYYYVQGDRWIVSDCVYYMVQVMRANNIAYHYNRKAAQYMLSYGYMLDDSTHVEEIHRLLPGCFALIENGCVEIQKYYTICSQEVQMSEQEAVERVDRAFREAVRREFEKDREYGYQHLVDLSGGLDSRMVSWVAHDMGFTDQLNMAYSRSGYLDDRISRQIACDLGHEYLFKPLDDARWLYDIDRNVRQNNGAALYSGITGGGRFLRALNTCKFGIEHTGMLGDVILSSYYQDESFSKGAPRYGYNQYSTKMGYNFAPELLGQYRTQEEFVIATRGVLGMQSSYMIRQHYVETSSPFMDVDFMDTAFSIPFKYRSRHHLYLMWIKEKYPEAARYGWEKWGGVRPKESHLLLRKIRTTQRLAKQMMCKMLKTENRDSMNPADAWYAEDMELQRYYKAYYEDNIDNGVFDETLRNNLSIMFRQGNVTEKSMALTVLSAARQYFGSQEGMPR